MASWGVKSTATLARVDSNRFQMDACYFLLSRIALARVGQRVG